MSQPKVIYLKDYQVPAFLIDQTQLHFELMTEFTQVTARLTLRRNPDARDQSADLFLQGDSELELQKIAIDGVELAAADYQRDDTGLTLNGLNDKLQLEVITIIHPDKNTALEGLYRSGGMFCTQCEAEGFRRITFYMDRPDVMSVFETTLVADKNEYPVLLSNGNQVAKGDFEDGRHWATWEDPFPKPAYLFALVAGDLAHIEDTFVTMSDRKITLKVYADEKDLDKLDYAMVSLKKSMRWDEEVFGREYDLDLFNIVAVDFFNMGAMENKGLNIFNTSCVLAHPQTTTDATFQRVEAIVAHEYFHNWSGNRVTCRDWFQLSLKEGFTVYRDAEFSSDMNSRTVKRIESVQALRTGQFSEDAGPMAHSIRPASFIEISNFYTRTVYEKGAEVVGMVHTLLGAEKFRAGSDLYFQRHDGQAVTTDDFISAMQDASGRDLSQFKNWYNQAGTPHLTITDNYDEQRQRYDITIVQSCPATPGQSEKLPFHLPFCLGLLDESGNDIDLAGTTTALVEVTKAQQTFSFDNIPVKPVPSLLRGFSAPVKLDYQYARQQLVFLISHDSDGFNRWEAAQKLGVDIIQELVKSLQQGAELRLDNCLIDAYRAVLADGSLDKAMMAQVLTLPSELYLAELCDEVEVGNIHRAREFVRKRIAAALEIEFLAAYQGARLAAEAYQPSAEGIAKRKLQNLSLSYLMALEKECYLELALKQYQEADNMTDSMAALVQVAHSNFVDAGAKLLAQFYDKWSENTLVVNQWFAVQASDPKAGALENVKELMQHPAFDFVNPNKVRSVVAAFCMQNQVNFHAEDGSGYQFLADQIIALDKSNPQLASRLIGPLSKWSRYTQVRQQLMREQLLRIMDSGELSADVFEVVSKSLA
ncbi:MAG: aminopeptidase N [Pseudomonadales bacterium]|nr:aminopeptidase N [Pseudomonadales bacterium]NRA14448.1 aminopeptidase N [Oceanospirillaceae bacterium]